MDRFEQSQLWAERIAELQQSGLTMKAWCEKTGHSYDQLKYWKCKYKLKQSAWLPVTVSEEIPAASQLVPSEPCLTMQIQLGAVRIDVYTGAQPEMLRDVLSALVPSC